MAVLNDMKILEKEGYTVEQSIEIIKAKELSDIRKNYEMIGDHLLHISLDLELMRKEIVNLFSRDVGPDEQHNNALRELLHRLEIDRDLDG